ncbi:NADP-dependent oxidoreductase [Schaalia hyovaginalis]|uniref:NADP-dependent oxidoreductase n=1 Tax=Schaalia hyovaginalis TaxID=29316 RepID=UPI002A802DAD|nr:NADP-dependent oxidoreductase [Schaalia hyovaginalis]MDY3665424.1 NADP-dependent oxidoreductase [Schaalia hyovaginalis]MDY5601433.1 NADP-dependent oxidoreductase [Schaalia hyovaginalis]
MKSAQLLKYDKQNTELALRDAPRPEPRPGQALLRVLAAGVNPLDNMISRGEVKLITPYDLPLIAGNEVVGLIESINGPARELTPGQRVFARLPLRSIGAFAEYVAVDLDALAPVPDYLSDVEAAAVPLTALTIIQALDIMKPTAGETIFISGGTGGVGAMAIPIAASRGLRIITNGSAENKERVLALGAERFLDYKTQDYTTLLSGIDHVLDTLGGAETEKQMSILKAGGHLVSLRGMPNGAFAARMGLSRPKRLLFTLAGRKFDRMAKRHRATYDFIFVESNGAQLREVAALLTQLQLHPSIDTVYPFERINEALHKIATGRSRGKTVLTFAKED